MQQILQAINNLGFTPIEQGESRVAARSCVELYAINPSNFRLKVEEEASVELVLLHGGDDNAVISINLGRGATLNLTEIFVGASTIEIDVMQAEESTSKVVAASLGYTTSKLTMQLCGQRAYSELYTLQMGAEKSNNAIRINMRHISPDCSSRSLSKCVSSGESNLHFDGLVYVAHDAQRTAAEQNCRCIELSDSSHIVAQPQLEIYADDVKCSHGATMGQVDSDAILYMRQRGLSEAQARRVQIEGFVTDIVDKCNIEELREALEVVVAQKLEEM